MKRYVFKDEDGKVVEVTELEEGEKPVEGDKPAPAKPEEGVHDDAFTPEQVEAIKSIVKEALAELNKPEEPAAPEEAHDAEGDKPGEVKKPEEKEVAHDSVAVKGANSVEQHKEKVADSVLPSEEEINAAWENRFKK